MRKAELIMAVAMGIFSLYLMWKSAELPIGWIKGEGPGGGAWPFWLSAIMLLSCIMIVVNWFRRTSPPSQSEDVYMDRGTLIEVGQIVVALTITIALFYIIGTYGALALFLLFYVGFYGRHSWRVTAVMVLVVPIVTFFFFEVALKIILPKGYSEPLFYPIYARVYNCPETKTWGLFAACLVDPKKARENP